MLFLIVTYILSGVCAGKVSRGTVFGGKFKKISWDFSKNCINWQKTQ